MPSGSRCHFKTRFAFAKTVAQIGRSMDLPRSRALVARELLTEHDLSENRYALCAGAALRVRIML